MDSTAVATDTVASVAPPAGATAAAAPTPAAAAPAARDSGDAAVAVRVIRDFYAAVNAHDFARAYAAWGSGGPPGHPTRAAFAAGYATTDSVAVTIGAPGAVEGAAGSRYVMVPVTVRAYERGGRAREYVGAYVLRRTVVPGASAADQRWHLYRATLRAK